jgi:hypothetical protein
MVYFVDYNGMIDPKAGREHIGQFFIGDERMLMLRPGIQPVPANLWEAVRGHREVGWDKESGAYKGRLVKNGTLTVYESKDGEMDWSSCRNLDDVARRTTVVSVLRSMLAYCERDGGREFLAKRIRDRLKDVTHDE